MDIATKLGEVILAGPVTQKQCQALVSWARAERDRETELATLEAAVKALLWDVQTARRTTNEGLRPTIERQMAVSVVALLERLKGFADAIEAKEKETPVGKLGAANGISSSSPGVRDTPTGANGAGTPGKGHLAGTPSPPHLAPSVPS